MGNPETATLKKKKGGVKVSKTLLPHLAEGRRKELTQDERKKKTHWSNHREGILVAT